MKNVYVTAVSYAMLYGKYVKKINVNVRLSVLCDKEIQLLNNSNLQNLYAFLLQAVYNCFFDIEIMYIC